MDSSDMLFSLVLYYLVGQCFVIAAPMRILRKAENYTGLQMIGGAIVFLLAWPIPLLVSLVKLGRQACHRPPPQQADHPPATAEGYLVSL